MLCKAVGLFASSPRRSSCGLSTTIPNADFLPRLAGEGRGEVCCCAIPCDLILYPSPLRRRKYEQPSVQNCHTEPVEVSIPLLLISCFALLDFMNFLAHFKVFFGGVYTFCHL